MRSCRDRPGAGGSAAHRAGQGTAGPCGFNVGTAHAPRAAFPTAHWPPGGARSLPGPGRPRNLDGGRSAAERGRERRRYARCGAGGAARGARRAGGGPGPGGRLRSVRGMRGGDGGRARSRLSPRAPR